MNDDAVGHGSLALFGGEPAVKDAPGFKWPIVQPQDAELVREMALAGELSYYGAEGYARELEQKFADYLGISRALATNSGTNALHSAFFGLGLQPGDEVLAPAYTFFATIMPLYVANAVPVLVDVEPDTGLIDAAEIERQITPRTRAIIVVHLWGNPVDMAPVIDIARRRNLRIVEDCSHAHGASSRGQRVGTFGDVAVFSLQGKKLVAAGQGGIMLTDNQEIFERAVLLGHFNVRAFEEVHSATYRPYAYAGMGLNNRIHPLAAAIANAQMDRLPSFIEGRTRNFEFLSSLLNDVPGVAGPVIKDHVTQHAYYTYKPTYDAAQLGGLPIDRYVEALRAEGLSIQRYDSEPLHLLEVFSEKPPPFISHGLSGVPADAGQRRVYKAGDFPGAEAYAARLLSLPAYTEDVRESLVSFADAFAKVAAHAPELS